MNVEVNLIDGRQLKFINVTKIHINYRTLSGKKMIALIFDGGGYCESVQNIIDVRIGDLIWTMENLWSAKSMEIGIQSFM